MEKEVNENHDNSIVPQYYICQIVNGKIYLDKNGNLYKSFDFVSAACDKDFEEHKPKIDLVVGDHFVNGENEPCLTKNIDLTSGDFSQRWAGITLLMKKN